MQPLLTTYQQAHYRVQAEPSFTLRIGDVSEPLLALYAQQGMTTAAFITAHNPRGMRYPATENIAFQQQLMHCITEQGLTWLPGTGEDPTGNWRTETSCLILGISQHAACEFGQHFQQNAIVFCESDGIPQLLWMNYDYPLS